MARLVKCIHCNTVQEFSDGEMPFCIECEVLLSMTCQLCLAVSEDAQTMAKHILEKHSQDINQDLGSDGEKYYTSDEDSSDSEDSDQYMVL
jgi:hypothetical protein